MAFPKAPRPRKTSVKSSLSAMYQSRGRSSRGQPSRKRENGLRRNTPRPPLQVVTIEVPTVTELLAYKLPPEHWDLGKPICNSNHHVSTNIMHCLTKRQGELFMATPFGHFFDAPSIELNQLLIHQVLMREINSDNPDEMWFHTGDAQVKFGLEEFCLISGLKCFGNFDHSKYANKYNRLQDVYFSEHKDTYRHVTEQVFKRKPSLDDSDTVKLAIIYLMKNLMYTTSRELGVDRSLMVLVDSEEMMDFAWGLHCFKATINALRGGMRNKTIKKKGNQRPTVSYNLMIAYWNYVET